KCSKPFQESDTLRQFFIVVLLLSGFGNLAVRAQAPPPETYKILGISVEGNDAKSGSESSAIIANSGLKVGDEITIPGDNIRQAIHRLWALRIFSDVQIFIENKAENG